MQVSMASSLDKQLSKVAESGGRLGIHRLTASSAGSSDSEEFAEGRRRSRGSTWDSSKGKGVSSRNTTNVVSGQRSTKASLKTTMQYEVSYPAMIPFWAAFTDVEFEACVRCFVCPAAKSRRGSAQSQSRGSTKDSAAKEMPLPCAGTFRFEISPALPANVQLDPSKGTIRGSPLMAQVMGQDYKVILRWPDTGEIVASCFLTFAVADAEMAAFCNAAFYGSMGREVPAFQPHALADGSESGPVGTSSLFFPEPDSRMPSAPASLSASAAQSPRNRRTLDASFEKASPEKASFGLDDGEAAPERGSLSLGASFGFAGGPSPWSTGGSPGLSSTLRSLKDVDMGSAQWPCELPLSRESITLAMGGSPLPARRASGSVSPLLGQIRPHTTPGSTTARPQSMNAGGKSRTRASVFPLGPPLRGRDTPSSKQEEALPPCTGVGGPRRARTPRVNAYPQRMRALY